METRRVKGKIRQFKVSVGLLFAYRTELSAEQVIEAQVFIVKFPR